MHVVIFTHSLVSDWNHGHVHFLRGVCRELLAAGHQVTVYEPETGWSLDNLIMDHGIKAVAQAIEANPLVARVRRTYNLHDLDAQQVMRDADIVIVQEWTDRRAVKALARAARRDPAARLYFHDAHHRTATEPQKIARLLLREFDGVLAFGDVVRDRYLEHEWARRAFTWHEAADTHVFAPDEPQDPKEPRRGVVWIGNWGDEERTKEFQEYLLQPARRSGVQGHVYGVRYPEHGMKTVQGAGLAFRGYVPNHRVPHVFSRHRFTVHIPRRAYLDHLAGVPTIRVFEALACGIPLVCSPWEDREGLFTPGRDFLMAHDQREMAGVFRMLDEDEGLRDRLARHGLKTILDRHTCKHRVDELMKIDKKTRGGQRAPQLHREHAAEQTKRVPSGDGRNGHPTNTNSDGPTMKRPLGQPTNGDVATGPRPARAHPPQPEPRKQDRYGPTIAFFGSSLTSSHWNGAATYYRGLLHALAKHGFKITFYEPAILDRHKHRDLQEPEWAQVVHYPPHKVMEMLERARGSDVVVKASGVGANDALLEEQVLTLQDEGTRVLYWDVDAPATLARLQADDDHPMRRWIPEYDMVVTYGGGSPVVRAYRSLGAKRCVPIYNGLDPQVHHPVEPAPRFEADLAFLGNRLPDRDARVDEFFLQVASKRPGQRFLLGGSGWEGQPLPGNVQALGHVAQRDHNAFNCSPRAVLNVHRDSMAQNGWSPATRVFEAAGAGACLISDASQGLEHFFEPDKEVLVAESGGQVGEILDTLDHDAARRIGEKARQRALREHTYDRRAELVIRVLGYRLREVLA